jgi:hypothetical protein
LTFDDQVGNLAEDRGGDVMISPLKHGWVAVEEKPFGTKVGIGRKPRHVGYAFPEDKTLKVIEVTGGQKFL